MKHNRNLLAEAIRYGLGAAAVAGLAMTASPVLAQDSDEQEASDLDRIQVTGSRIARPAADNTLPVTVLDREQIMASGDVNIADFLRNTSFNSFGSYQSSSGNSFAGASFVNMRGLGQGRTLVLINGRRAPMSPNAGDGQDLNSVPMAAVERIEVLSAGASAIYGSDALGGVINIITRSDMDGVEYTAGISRPSRSGGDGKEMNIVFGTTSDRGQLLGGASYTERDVIMSRDRDYFMEPRGGSVYSNNFTLDPEAPTAASSFLNHPTFGAAVPGYCHNETEYFWVSGGRCSYEHTMHSASLTALDNTAIFLRGNYDINDNWRAYFDASVSRVESFGRFAPVPSSPWPGGAIHLPIGSPNHPSTPVSEGGFNEHYADEYYSQFADTDMYLLHRFAALGARDSFYESNTYTYVAGAEAQIGIVDLDFGMRYSEQRSIDMGQNYVVGNLAQRHITSGAYNVYDPLNVDPDIAKSMINTITRDMGTVHKEFYASGAFDMFQMNGGAAAMVIGAEYREEDYKDIYDPLSEAGEIVGSAGNSAFGGRDVTSVYAETLFPIMDNLELTVAARWDDYSDYGDDFSPMAGVRWAPIDGLTFRASYGEGFRAPSLRLVSLQPSFSATATSDPATCVMLTGDPSCNTQLSTYSIANPNLESEQSEQFGLGVVWEPTNWLQLELDYYNIEITNSISSVGALTIANCLRGTGQICPAGLTQFPEGTTIPNPSLGLGATFDPATGGIVNAQTGFTNLGTVETDGFDLSASTNFDFGSLGYLQSQLQLSYVNDYSVNGGDNVAGNDIYTPELRGGLSNVWTMGDWSFSWVMNYVDGWPTYVNVYLGGIDGYADHVGSWITHDLQVAYEAPWNATITLGANNIADKDPQIDEVWGPEFDLYDPWGRVPYIRYTQRF